MKIGDYVRTDTGKIGKITLFEGDLVRVDTDKFITYKSNHNEIKKSSPNIIDLIEVGDYVNGYLIAKIYDVFETNPNKLKEAHIRYADEDFISQLYDNEIKSIVTKEQFKSMQYE